MTRSLKFPEADAAGVASLITQSVRCWREACDANIPVQPHLFSLLDAYGRAMLAPVFDSLFCFYEAALERPLAVGAAKSLSKDERLLLSLVDCPDLHRSKLDCPRGLAAGLNCALCSTRIMLSLTQREAVPCA